jgi:iron complex transport system substrate-binding protein
LPLLINAADKVVSLSPTVTQLILYLNGADRLCGRSSACHFPEISSLPVAGDLGRPFPEAVLSTGANIVISDIAHPEANWDILRRYKVQVKLLDTSSISRLPENIRIIGHLLKNPDAGKTAAELEEKIFRMRKAVPAKTIHAVILFGTAPLITCGRKSFITDAMKLAGIENVAENAGDGYFIVTPEYLYRSDPEVIIIIGVPRKVADHDLKHGLLRSLPAVKNNRIIFADPEKWSRLTPDILDAAESLRLKLTCKQSNR